MYVQRRERIIDWIDWFFLASVFSQSETSEALTEICRVDPTFDVVQFIRIVQYDIIPNIFEVRTKRWNCSMQNQLVLFSFSRYHGVN